MSDPAGETPIVDALAAGVRAALAGAAAGPWAGPRPSAAAVCAIMAADAPVSPEQLTGAPPGVLYSMRPVGGLIPPAAGDGLDRSTAAALEFAVKVLGVRELILFGHAESGFVRALVTDATPAAAALVQGDYLPSLTGMLAGAAMRARAIGADDHLRAKICTQEIMRLSIENLMTYPWLLDRLLDGSVRLHGWYVDGAAGGFERLDPAADAFVPDQAAPLTDGK